MHDSISFGSWLRQKRRALDLSQKAFAEQVGCAEITVRRMEADEYKPSKELALTLFEKLGIPESERPQWVHFARGMSSLPSQSPPQLNQPGSNLPVSLTSFIGREKEQVEVIQLIRKHRLVTLTGSGGVGKTRFAIKVGGQLLENYPDGVWWIELASLNDPAHLPQNVATLFGLITHSGVSHTDLLVNFLRTKHALLVFDNCEHLLDACAQLADLLLKNCIHLKILVTSREPLQMEGEALYRIPSLNLPEPPYQLDTLQNFESIKLFEERAQLVQFDFCLTPENALSVAEICQSLDGIPLAIELAAAKVGVLSTAQIARQLSESLDLLTGGSRTALPRHKTLRASINWSWNLLSEAEQRLMRQLSVFAGGWSLDAAQNVCEGDVLLLLNSLVNKSLIVLHQTTGKQTRYFFHEIIHNFVREKLAQTGETEAVRGRHFDFFLSFALSFEKEVHGSQMSTWMASVNAEHGNLREAMKWAGECGRVRDGLRLGYALHYYWLSKGYWGVGREALERLLVLPEAAGHTLERADALNLSADLATYQGDLQAARALLQESKTIALELGEAGKPSLGWACMLLGQTWVNQDPIKAKYEYDKSTLLLREAGEPWRLAIILLMQGWLAGSQGELTRAREWFSESLAIFQNIGDVLTAALPTQALGWVFYCLGEYDKASAYFHRALEVYHTVEDKIYTPNAFAHLGAIALLLGNLDQAIGYFDSRLLIVRDLMNKERIAGALCDLGIAIGHQGDSSRAKTLLRRGLEISQEIDSPYLIAVCIIGLASIEQTPQRAAKMLAAAHAILERDVGFVEPLYRLEQEWTENRFRERLDMQEVEKLLVEGSAMTIDQVVAYLLEEY